MKTKKMKKNQKNQKNIVLSRDIFSNKNYLDKIYQLISKNLFINYFSFNNIIDQKYYQSKLQKNVKVYIKGCNICLI